MEKLLTKNYVTFLGKVMKKAGCTKDIREAEDVMSNLYYLSKEDGNGRRFIPLQYKRIIEKLICGMFNTAFEYNDKTDVYFEKVGDTTICCANVYWVKYLENGEKQVLGHGFHSLALSEIFSGVFMSDEERISKWKSTVIGGAKSWALYDGGIGLEFYGDVFAPEENLDEKEVSGSDAAPKKRGRPKKVKEEAAEEEKTYSESGMPVPKPKKEPDADIKKPEVPKMPDRSSETDPVEEDEPEAAASETEKVNSEMSIESAKNVIADVGNYKGIPLGKIYDVAPANIIYLVNRSDSIVVKDAALAIINSDPDLKDRYNR